jgi:hypothetical protein
LTDFLLPAEVRARLTVARVLVIVVMPVAACGAPKIAGLSTET